MWFHRRNITSFFNVFFFLFNTRRLFRYLLTLFLVIHPLWECAPFHCPALFVHTIPLHLFSILICFDTCFYFFFLHSLCLIRSSYSRLININSVGNVCAFTRQNKAELTPAATDRRDRGRCKIWNNKILDGVIGASFRYVFRFIVVVIVNFHVTVSH